MSLRKEREAEKRAKAFQKGSPCCTDVGRSYSISRTSERKGAAAAQDEAEEADPQQPSVRRLSPPRLDHPESHIWWLDMPIAIIIILTFTEFPLQQIFHVSAEQF